MIKISTRNDDDSSRNIGQKCKVKCIKRQCVVKSKNTMMFKIFEVRMMPRAGGATVAQVARRARAQVAQRAGSARLRSPSLQRQRMRARYVDRQMRMTRPRGKCANVTTIESQRPKMIK